MSGLSLLALNQTRTAITNLQSFSLKQAAASASQARPIVRVFQMLTLNQVPDIRAWNQGLGLIIELQQLESITATFSTNFANQTSQPADLSQVLSQAREIEVSARDLSESLDQSWYLRNQLPPETLAQLQSGRQQLTQILDIGEFLTRDSQTWVIVFQNTTEVRATGGFAGSYALLHLQNGKLGELVIEDIYDADGQFEGFVSPPSGVREYTSGSRGLRLPDANWWPDYPKSSQVMLQFFALGNRDDVVGIAAINVEVIEKILQITGPVWLPDYDTQLTADNTAQVLRTDRENFFPGSSQKKHLISHAATMLKEKVASLNAHEFRQLAQMFLQLPAQKSIQIYATNPELQNELAQLHLTGEIGTTTAHAQSLQNRCNCMMDTLMLVESNVGINKVNSEISRSVLLDWNKQNQTLVANVTYKHTGNYVPTKPDENTGYVNYQRLIFSPEYAVTTVSIGDQILEAYDLETISTHRGEELRQLGFLVPVLSGTEQQVSITLQRQSPISHTHGLLIHKQSGLPGVPYELINGSSFTSTLLERDTILPLTPSTTVTY